MKKIFNKIFSTGIAKGGLLFSNVFMSLWCVSISSGVTEMNQVHEYIYIKFLDDWRGNNVFSGNKMG